MNGTRNCSKSNRQRNTNTCQWKYCGINDRLRMSWTQRCCSPPSRRQQYQHWSHSHLTSLSNINMIVDYEHLARLVTITFSAAHCVLTSDLLVVLYNWHQFYQRLKITLNLCEIYNDLYKALVSQESSLLDILYMIFPISVFVSSPSTGIILAWLNSNLL